MTAKSNISVTYLEKEQTFHGSGDGNAKVISLTEQLDTSSLVRESLKRDSVRSSIWDLGEAPSLGLKQGELQASVYLTGLGSNTGGTVQADNDDYVLSSVIGSSSGGTGTTTSGTWTSTGGDVASASGLEVGEMIMVGNKVAAISSIVSNAVTVTPPLPAAPSSGTTVYAGLTYQPSDVRNTWIVKHYRDNNYIGYKCTGCGIVPEFANLGAGEGQAKVNLKISVGDWAHDTTYDITTAPAPNTFTRQGVVQNQGRFVVSDGTNNIQCIVSSFNVSGLMGEVRRQDACQPNCIGVPELIPPEDRTIEVELWQLAGANADPISRLRTWFESGSPLELLYQIGNKAGDTVAFYFPAVFVNAEPKEVDKNGLMAIKVMFKVTRNMNSTVFTKHFYMARF